MLINVGRINSNLLQFRLGLAIIILLIIIVIELGIIIYKSLNKK